jgi:hypothetical protein
MPPAPAVNARKLRISIASLSLLLAICLSPPAHADAIGGSISIDRLLESAGQAEFGGKGGNAPLIEADRLAMSVFGLGASDEYADGTDQSNIDGETELIATFSSDGWTDTIVYDAFTASNAVDDILSLTIFPVSLGTSGVANINEVLFGSGMLSAILTATSDAVRLPSPESVPDAGSTALLFLTAGAGLFLVNWRRICLHSPSAQRT